MPRAQGQGETGNRSRGWPGPCAGAILSALHKLHQDEWYAAGAGPSKGAARINFAQRIKTTTKPQAVLFK